MVRADSELVAGSLFTEGEMAGYLLLAAGLLVICNYC